MGGIRLLTAVVVCGVKWGIGKEPLLAFAGAVERAWDQASVLKLAIAMLLFVFDDELIERLPLEIRSEMRELKDKVYKGEGAKHD
jgi:hypothetical protein